MIDSVLGSWEFWSGVFLVALILEFLIGGVGILAIVAVAASIVTGEVLLLRLFSLFLGWKAATLSFVISLLFAQWVVRKGFMRKRTETDLNEY